MKESDKSADVYRSIDLEFHDNDKKRYCHDNDNRNHRKSSSCDRHDFGNEKPIGN